MPPFPTWLDVARDARESAALLLQARLHRSATSRAYYAVYSRVTHQLALQGVSMPRGMDGPSHQKLPALIEDKLIALSPEKRRAVAKWAKQLYVLRISADYGPYDIIGAVEARQSVILLNKVFHEL